jgi:hypothetical protein
MTHCVLRKASWIKLKSFASTIVCQLKKSIFFDFPIRLADQSLLSALGVSLISTFIIKVTPEKACNYHNEAKSVLFLKHDIA